MKNTINTTSAKTTNVADYIESLSLDDLAGELLDYIENDNGCYISDAISEIADNNVSLYYSDVERFMCENIGRVERAIDEFGWDGCGSDLHKAAQMGEYIMHMEELCKSLEDIMLAYSVKYISREIDALEIPNDIIDELEDNSNNFARYDHPYQIDNELNTLIEECKERKAS